ncbi:TonB-dependent receptor [Novosphingobium sp.]|uniref:TonB-dependent receptor n=1 Tax=Novosphingobium sp. TaxID=1874826 RepID=UPI00286A9B68|nr:TonB-dependent receptor [Novosphingobium sp.]
MKSALRTATALPLVALSLSLLASPAMAQGTSEEAATADDAAPGDIVVTAQKRKESLQSVPLAVSVLSGERLADASRPSIETAAQMVPSLNFLKSGTTLNQTIFLRGVGTATFSIAGEPSVSTVVDGVVYSRSGEAFSDMVDVAQIEVLRGPQGTLFGKNASAGVVNITTQMPRQELGGSIEASYFEGNEVRVKGSVNAPVGTNSAVRLTGFYGEYDGNIQNTFTGNKVNGYKHYGARGQFLYEPSNDLRVYLAADYYKNDDDCCADIIATGPLTGAGVPSTSLAFGVLPAPAGAKTRAVNQNLVTATKEQGWGVSGQVDFSLGNHTLTSITAYRGWDNTEIRDGDWLPMAYVGFNQLHDNGPQTSTTFSQELRLTSPADQTVSYVLGAYYSRAESERTFTRVVTACTAAVGAPTGVLIPCGSVNANPSTVSTGSATFGSVFNNFAAFGQVTLKFGEDGRGRIVGGLRYTNDKLSVFHSRVSSATPAAAPGIQPNFDQGVYNQYLVLVAGGTAPNTAAGLAVTSSNGIPYRTETSNDNLSGKAAIQYDFSPDMMGYLSYARGYKGPAYNVFFNLASTGTNVIEPETSDSVELGIKNTLAGGKLTLNIAVFYAKYQNFQANNPDLVATVVVTRFTNAGSVSTRGLELDWNYRPSRNTTLSGGLALTDAHVDQFKAAPGAAPTAIIPSGTKLGYAPTWKGSLALDQRFVTGKTFDVGLGISTNFQSAQLSLFAPDPVQRQLGTIPGYMLVNMSVSVMDVDSKWKLSLQVRNLFDKAYPAAIINGGVSGSYRYQIPRDADRYWGVSARVSF